MSETPSRTFETALARLEVVVKELEADGIDLDRSVTLFQEGRDLVRECETLLAAAEQLLTKAESRPESTASAEDSDDADEMPF